MASFDPVLTELIRHEFISISEEMNTVMRQTARSMVAREASELSAGLLTVDGQVMGQAMLYGLGYFSAVMPYLLEKFSGQFRPGDVFLTNDPYGGASHLPDIVLIKPLFWEQELCGFAAVVEHHTDIGGRYPGGMGAESADLFHEGLRLPAVRFHEGGCVSEAVREIIAANVRTPADVLGDLDAALAACRRGEQGYLRVLAKYGREAVEACRDQLFRNAEAAVRDMLRQIPSGTYRAESEWSDGAGITLKLALGITTGGGEITVDLSGSGAQVPKAYNVPPDMIDHILAAELFYLIDAPDIPINSGLYAPIRVVAPKGSVFNPAFPAAVASRATILMPTRDLLYRALGEALPDRMPAGNEGGHSSITFATRLASGETAMLTDLYGSGWGGRPGKDGIEGAMPLILSQYLSPPTEVFEREVPIMLEGCGFVSDTGGPGQYRGALSVYRSFRFLADGQLIFRTVRVGEAPRGRNGGRDGNCGEFYLLRDGQRVELPRAAVNELQVSAGDVFVHVQHGAGGYGDPYARDPEKVLLDVLEEKISASYAEREYGVAIDRGGEIVDIERTRALRER